MNFERFELCCRPQLVDVRPRLGKADERTEREQKSLDRRIAAVQPSSRAPAAKRAHPAHPRASAMREPSTTASVNRYRSYFYNLRRRRATSDPQTFSLDLFPARSRTTVFLPYNGAPSFLRRPVRRSKICCGNATGAGVKWSVGFLAAFAHRSIEAHGASRSHTTDYLASSSTSLRPALRATRLRSSILSPRRAAPNAPPRSRGDRRRPRPRSGRTSALVDRDAAARPAVLKRLPPAPARA